MGEGPTLKDNDHQREIAASWPSTAARRRLTQAVAGCFPPAAWPAQLVLVRHALRRRAKAQIVQAAERGDHLAVVDLEVEVDEHVALAGGGSEPLGQLAFEVAGLGEVEEDPRVVGRRPDRKLAGQVRSDIDEACIASWSQRSVIALTRSSRR